MVLAQSAVAQKEIAKVQVTQESGSSLDKARGAMAGKGKAGAPAAKEAALAGQKGRRKADQVPLASSDWATYEFPQEILDTFTYIEFYKKRGINIQSFPNVVCLN